jgi:hypothetical protein
VYNRRYVASAAPEPVARLLQAANGNDIDAFLAGFAGDGVVDDWGRAFTGGDGFNGPSHFSFEVQGDHVARMTIRA